MRFFLVYVVPLLLPSALYFGFGLLARRLAKRGGPLGVWFLRLPWFWLGLSGLVLLGISLTVYSLTSGSAPRQTYVPPHFEDGRVVPARVE
jgi:hypothetical protein